MAKLPPERLLSTLNRKLDTIYLLYGDEPLLLQEAADAIRAEARKKGFDSREVFHAEAGFDWGQLYEAASSLSLFTERKLLELRMDSGKPGDAGSKAIVEYCQSPSPDNLLLITAGKLGKDSQRGKWYKTLEEHATVVQYRALTPQQIPAWIEQRLLGYEMTIDREALMLLTERVENNLLAASQEVEKLQLFYRGQEITRDIVLESVADSSRHNVFLLTDRLLSGDTLSAIKTLQGLRLEGLEPTLIVWALSRELRQLATLQSALEQGAPWRRLAQEHRLWKSREMLVQKALKRLPLSQLQELLHQLADIDRMTKGLIPGNIWDELSDLILAGCGTHVSNRMNHG